MDILFYKESESIEHASGSLKNLYKKLNSKYPALLALLEQTLIRIKRSENLDAEFQTGYAGNLKGRNLSDILELRIPPQKKGGVIRLYFAFLDSEKTKLKIYAGELKKGSKANDDVIESARRRYKEDCK